MMISDPWGLLLNQSGGGSIDMSRGFSAFGNFPTLDWMPNPGAEHGVDVRGQFPWNVADSYTYFRWYESVLLARAREEDRRLLLGDSAKTSPILLASNSGEIQLDTSAPPTRAVFVGYIEKDGILHKRYIINGQVEDIRVNLTEDVTVVAPREDSVSTLAGQGATDPDPYWVKETVIYKEEVDFHAGQGAAPAVPDHRFGYYPIAQKRDRVARHGTEEFRAGRYISGLIDYVQEVILSNAAQLENIMPYNAPDHFLAAGQYAKRWTWYSMRGRPYKGLYELGKGHLEAGDAVVGVGIGAAGVKGGYRVARSIDWGAVARAPAYAFVGAGSVGAGKPATQTLGPVLESALPSETVETAFANMIDNSEFSRHPEIIDLLSRTRKYNIGGYKSLTAKGTNATGKYGRPRDGLDSDEALQNGFVRHLKGILRDDSLLEANPSISLPPELHHQIGNLTSFEGRSAADVLRLHIDQMRGFTPDYVLVVLERESLKFIELLGL
jgi:hypothetical protein